MDKIKETGAVLIATIIWRCTHENGCSRGIEVTRMDQSEIGFNLTSYEYSKSEDGKTQFRTEYKGTGIRIYTKAKGEV